MISLCWSYVENILNSIKLFYIVFKLLSNVLTDIILDDTQPERCALHTVQCTWTMFIEHVWCALYDLHCTLYSRGRQPMARSPNVALFKKIMALFKFWGVKKGTKKIWKKWLKNTSWWPSTKKVYNFTIFWPTNHKRFATPAVQCTLYNIPCTLYIVDCTVYNVYTVYDVQCILYCIHIADCMYNIQYTRCTLYNVHIVHCAYINTKAIWNNS